MYRIGFKSRFQVLSAILFLSGFACSSFGQTQAERAIRTIQGDQMLSHAEVERRVAIVKLEAARLELKAIIGGKNFGEVLHLTERLVADWRDARADESARLFAISAAELLPLCIQSPELTDRMILLGGMALNRLPEASEMAGTEVLDSMAFSRPLGNGVVRSVSDFLDRESFLSSYLQLQQRVHDYLDVTFEDHASAFKERSDPNLSRPIFGTPPAEIEKLRERFENHARFMQQEQQWRFFTETNYGPTRAEQLTTRIGLFVNKRFANTPEDSRLVEAALQHHIKTPTLRERLSVVIYGEAANQPTPGIPRQSPQARAGPQNVAQQAASNGNDSNHLEPQPQPPGAGASFASTIGASSRPLAVSLVMLSIVAIIFVLWRAQSRGHPRPK